MRSLCRVLLVLASLLHQSANGAPALQQVFSALPGELVWQPAEPDYSIADGVINIRPAKGTDLYISVDGQTNILTAPRLLFSPSADFTYSAHIAVSPEGQYNGGALVLYSDDKNWVKYLYEAQGPDKLGVVMDVVRDGVSDIGYFDQSSKKQITLKIAKSGDQLFFYHSSDETHWKLDRVLPAGHFPRLKAGFEAQAPTSAQAQIQLSQVKYRASAPENPWQLQPHQ